MAQVRAAIRAYIAVDPAPEVVLRQLDRLFSTYDVGQLVTLVYAVVDVARDELVMVNAGHPPPLVLRSDGSTEQLPYADGAPLGTETSERQPTVIPFRAGDTLVAYTDGLIERRDEDIDHGQERALDAVWRLRDAPLGEALEALVDTVRDHSREDDVAVLVARRSV
jgi:serine phosphatase RsbU (regulator of sigma subunit)